MGSDAVVSRVPTDKGGWSVETALDYILALIAANDRGYQQRFEASEKALDLGFLNQKSAVDAAFSSQKSAIDAAFSAQKEAINAALAAADRAVNKAELATEKRFESVNEFRGTLDNQQRTLIPRSEVAVIKDGLEEKIAQLTKQMDEMRLERSGQIQQRSGLKEGWGVAVGIVGLVMLVVGLLSGVLTLIARMLPVGVR